MYATVQDMTARFGDAEMRNLTDRTQPRAGAIQAAVADVALREASSEADSYLAARYAVPLLAPYPERLVGAVCDIARFSLWTEAREDVVLRAEAARAWLKDVAKGLVALGVPSAQAEPAGATSSDGVAFSAPCRPFATDNLADFASQIGGF